MSVRIVKHSNSIGIIPVLEFEIFFYKGCKSVKNV